MRSGSGDSDGYASSGSSAGGWSPSVAHSLLVQHTARQSSSSSESPIIGLASLSVSGAGAVSPTHAGSLSPPVAGTGSGSGSEPALLQQQPPLQGVGEASWLAGGGMGIAGAIGGMVGQAPANANEPPALINLTGLPTAEVDDFLRSLLNLPSTQQPAAPAAQALPQASNEEAPSEQPQAHFSFRGLILGPTPVNSPLSQPQRYVSRDGDNELCFLIVS